MKSIKLIVAYPQPKDIAAFDKIYQEEHVPMAIAKLAGKTKMVATKILSPHGESPFYRVAEVHFPSMEALQKCAGVCGRQGDVGQCGEDIVRWPSRHHDRRRGYVHVLSDHLLIWQRDFLPQWRSGCFRSRRCMARTSRPGPTLASRCRLFLRRTRMAATRLSNPSWARKGPCSCSSVRRIGDRSARSSSWSWNNIWVRSGSRASV
jgi:uncharacterized protein (TIGR02118 family)